MPVSDAQRDFYQKTLAHAFKNGFVLRKGSTGKTVRALQLFLADQGFDPKGADGKFGNDTQAAYDAYAAANSIGKGSVGLKGLKTITTAFAEAPTPIAPPMPRMRPEADVLGTGNTDTKPRLRSDALLSAKDLIGPPPTLRDDMVPNLRGHPSDYPPSWLQIGGAWIPQEAVDEFQAQRPPPTQAGSIEPSPSYPEGRPNFGPIPDRMASPSGLTEDPFPASFNPNGPRDYSRTDPYAYRAYTPDQGTLRADLGMQPQSPQMPQVGQMVQRPFSQMMDTNPPPAIEEPAPQRATPLEAAGDAVAPLGGVLNELLGIKGAKAPEAQPTEAEVRKALEEALWRAMLGARIQPQDPGYVKQDLEAPATPPDSSFQPPTGPYR